MSTKNKIMLVASLMLLIASSFVVVSVLFLQDKKTFSEMQEEATENIETLENSSEKSETEKGKVSEKELEPREVIDKEIQAIIDDMKKQEISFETELNYFE